MTLTKLRPYRWAELDALVEEELDIETRPAPAPVDPATEQALFVEQAAAFLATHPEPRAILAELEALLPPPPADPEPEPEPEALAEEIPPEPEEPAP